MTVPPMPPEGNPYQQQGATPPPPPPPPTPQYPQQGPIVNNQGQGQSNGAATAAMILGILSFCGILAIPAIILGFIGRSKANELGGTGKGQATAGIVLGIAWMVVGILMWLGIVVLGIFAEEAGRDLEESFGNIGDSVSAGDYEISGANVEIDEFSIIYSGFITNKTPDTESYSIDFRCESNTGEVYTSSTYVSDVRQDDRVGFEAFLSFVDDPTSVSCEVTDVTYSF